MIRGLAVGWLASTDPGAMGEKGRAWASDAWSWDRSYERLRELLSRTVAS